MKVGNQGPQVLGRKHRKVDVLPILEENSAFFP